MTNERVRTRFVTDAGEFSFQEYFVRERLGPTLRAIEFEGIDSARPTPEVVAALEEAELVIIGPSNPLISIAPILEVIGTHIPREHTVAITPDCSRGGAERPDGRDDACGRSPANSGRRRAHVPSGGRRLRARQPRQRDVRGGERDGVQNAGVFDTVMTDGGGALAGAILEALT